MIKERTIQNIADFADPRVGICELLCGNSVSVIPTISKKVDLTFMDPPFNQQKDYAFHNDNMPQEQYWEMMKDVCRSIYGITREGGCLYFMQREKIRNMSCE